MEFQIEVEIVLKMFLLNDGREDRDCPFEKFNPKRNLGVEAEELPKAPELVEPALPDVKEPHCKCLK